MILCVKLVNLWRKWKCIYIYQIPSHPLRGLRAIALLPEVSAQRRLGAKGTKPSCGKPPKYWWDYQVYLLFPWPLKLPHGCCPDIQLEQNWISVSIVEEKTSILLLLGRFIGVNSVLAINLPVKCWKYFCIMSTSILPCHFFWWPTVSYTCSQELLCGSVLDNTSGQHHWRKCTSESPSRAS